VSKRDTFTFEGFEPANTTPVPDVLFDVLLPKLSGAELKVLLYIIRRTTGFKKTTDTISFTQFEKGIVTKDGRVLDSGCGLSRETISQALAGLETKGCIKSHKRNTTSGDKDTSAYSVRFKREVVGKSDYPRWSENLTTVVGKSDYGGQINRLPVVRFSDIQETVLQETVLQETDSQEGTYGANAPTPAHPSLQKGAINETRDVVDEKIEEIKHITGEHAAVHANETQYHIANSSAIGNDDFRLQAPGQLTLAAKGATHGTRDTAVSASGGTRGPLPGMASHPSTPLVESPSEQAPDTADVLSRHGDAGSVQAHPSLSASPEPAQVVIPPTAGSVASGVPTAQASGRRRTIPERPKGVKVEKPPVMPEPPKITLLAQEQVCWDLWRNVWFNQGIELELTPTAYGHVRKLAPHITTQEQMESLVKRARQDLEDNTGVKRKTVYLGNCVNSLPGWKQEQAAAQGPPEEKPVDKYTAASRDRERQERGLQRLRDMAIAEGKELPK
jgi:hypothetical protein